MATKTVRKSAEKSGQQATEKQRTPAQVVKEIRRRYGDVIDLKAQPKLMIEILSQFTLVAGVDGSGGVSPGTSTVAVGITPPASLDSVAEIREVLQALLKLQKQVATMNKQIERMAK